MRDTTQQGQRMLIGLAVLLGCVFLAIVTVNITHLWKSTQIKQQSAEQLLYISRFSANLATSHLWLEEAMSANNNETLKLYRKSLAKAIAAYWMIPQPKNSLLSDDMAMLMKYIQYYDELATIRINDTRHAGVNSSLDQQFDANFERIMVIAEGMSQNIYQRVNQDQKERQLIQKITLMTSLIILILVGLVVHLFIRRLQKLKQTEKNNIRALRASQQRLQASEKHLQQAQLVAHIGSWEITEKTKALLWSDEVYRIFGLPENTEPSYQFLIDSIHPEDKSRVEKAWLKHTKEQAEYNIIHRIIRPDGATAYLHERCESTYNDQGKIIHSIGTVQDVTHLMLAKQEARLLQAVFHTSSDMIGIANVDFSLLYANKALRRSLALSETQALDGISLANCYDPDVLDKVHDSIVPTVLKLGLWQGEMTMKHHTHGSMCVSQIVQAHRDDEQNISHISMIARDISKEKEQQKKLEHGQRLESLGVLAGGIAHDFNNLLTAIMGHASMACEQDDGQKRAQHLDVILTSSQSAADLCRQMLAYSGKGKFIIQPINISTVVADMGQLLAVSIDKKVQVHYELGDPLPIIMGDKAQIQQLAMNLVMNASEAIGAQVGDIHLQTGQCHIDSSSEQSPYLSEALVSGDYVYLEVSDTGCGMDKNVQAHLFEPFFTTKFTGRGLGMSAILGIVRGHHGSILLSSKVGQGSTFKVLLPAESDCPSVAAPRSTPLVMSKRAEGCLLVVDDEPMIRQLAVMVIKAMGFSTMEAADGIEAIAVFTEHQRDIVGVVLDMTMPRMGGEETFVALRKIKPDIPVLLSSGYDEHTAMERLVDVSVTAFIQKPYTAKQLQEMISEVVPLGMPESS